MHEKISELKDKTGEDFDLSFISMMIEHHQEGIDMAREARQKAAHEETKNVAEQIILEDETEILQMKDLRQSWGYARDMGEEFKRSEEEAEG